MSKCCRMCTDFLTYRNQRLASHRQKDIYPRAKANEPITHAAIDPISRLDVAKDSARDQPCNLDASEPSTVVIGDLDGISLVLGGSLIERCIDELAWAVGDLPNTALDRRPVGVNVKDVHKHADLK